MLWQRLTFGSLMIAALVGLIWLDQTLQAGAPPLPLPTSAATGWSMPSPRHALVIAGVWALVAAFATREMGVLLQHKGHKPEIGFAIGCNVLLALLPWLAVGRDASRALLGDLDWMILLLVAAVPAAFAFLARHRRTDGGAANLAFTLFLIVYVGVLGSFIPRLRLAAGTSWMLLYVLLVIKSCDIGAYFTGRMLGRNKLIEWLSPKKTIEGLAGGIVLAMVTAVLLSWWFSTFATVAGDTLPRIVWPSTLTALVLGGTLAVVGQTGDLLESLIKRDVGAKDSGALVPAFGGLLDILDSPLVCVPIAYLMLLQ